MKKTVLILITLFSIVFFASQALACYWDGYWGGHMGGPMGGSYADTYAGGNYQEFYDDTSKLRQNLAAKQGEYNALMASQNPDPKRATRLNSEISVLHDQLRAQARSHNLPAPNTGYGSRMGGHGYCW